MSEDTRKRVHDEKSLEKLTIKELREIAAELPHERAIHDMKKEELIAFVREARGIRESAPAAKKKHPVKIRMAKPALKARIRELKALRAQARESSDRGGLVRLRRQITRLKKKSRHVAAA
jgi:hypothetical protein